MFYSYMYVLLQQDSGSQQCGQTQTADYLNVLLHSATVRTNNSKCRAAPTVSCWCRQETQRSTWRVRMHTLRLLASCCSVDPHRTPRTTWVLQHRAVHSALLHDKTWDWTGSCAFRRVTHVCMWLLATTTWLWWRSCWDLRALWWTGTRYSTSACSAWYCIITGALQPVWCAACMWGNIAFERQRFSYVLFRTFQFRFILGSGGGNI